MIRRRSLVLLPVIWFLQHSLYAQKGHTSHPKTSSSKSSSSKSSSSSKPVHVKEYKLKHGTVVRAHGRSAPGTKPPKTSTPKTPRVQNAAKLTNGTTSEPSPAAINELEFGSFTICRRSRFSSTNQAKRRRTKAFHDTDRMSEGTEGLVVDHIVPLECGGADAPSNTQ